MRYVLDSNVGFKWAFIEQDTDKARKLRYEYQTGSIDLLAPDVFPIEFAHAVTRAERGKISLEYRIPGVFEGQGA